MEDTNTNDLLEKKHDRLWRIASILKVLAWIALIGQTMYTCGRFFNLENTYISTGSILENQTLFQYKLQHELFFGFRIVIDLFMTFMRGWIYWLALKGISLGLFMIIETDVNYREKLQEEFNE